MQQYQFTVTAQNGMHARPAGLLASGLQRFSSEITVCVGEKCADGKRLLSLMRLGAVQGSVLTFTITGEDETEALAKVSALCNQYLKGGESAYGEPN